MRTDTKKMFACCLLALSVPVAGCVSSGKTTAGAPRPYPDPTRFELSILTFEGQDAVAPPPEGAVLALGSSSILLWHPTIQQDLAPLTIIPRGFGGSTMTDALHYMDRIVLPYKPRAVLVYEGDNDIAHRMTPEEIRDGFHTLVARTREVVPDVRFYMLAIKPSPKRWLLWPEMKQANSLLREACEADPALTYIDIVTPMMDNNGEPKKNIFQSDALHLNKAGYALWRDAVRDALLAIEAPYEK
jgi:lysophospholipase L1-like esterase